MFFWVKCIMTNVKIQDLIDALLFESEENQSWVDRTTGNVVTLSSSLLGAIEEGAEEVLEKLPEWEREDVDSATAIVVDSGERFLRVPTKFDFHEYHQMERFIDGLEDHAAAEQLWRAIRGAGAFRRFKEIADRLDLLNAWYEFREECMKAFVREWAKEHEVLLVDDVP